MKTILGNQDTIQSNAGFRKLQVSGSCILFAILINLSLSGLAQSGHILKKVNKASSNFAQKASEGTMYKFKVDTFIVNPEAKTLNLKMNPTFSYLPFRPENTKSYYSTYSDLLRRKFRKYSISIESMGKEISDLIPNYYRGNEVEIDSSRFVKQSKKIIPIVRNVSKDESFAGGLINRNIALWHS
ncbi:MAG: hypothetical protein WAO52_09800, partial [Prolixibacteraceae bacterium]